MSKYRHTPSAIILRVQNKVTWLRSRTDVDLDVVETIEVIEDALTRLDAHIRTLDSRISKLENPNG